METRTFKATSMAEALHLTKANLGADAMIISARHLNNAKREVEVTAVSTLAPEPKAKAEKSDKHEAKKQAGKNSDDIIDTEIVSKLMEDHLAPFYEEFTSLRRMVRELRQLTNDTVLPGFGELKHILNDYSEGQESSRILGPLYSELVEKGVLPQYAKGYVRACEMELGLQNLGQRDWLTLAKGLLRQIIVRETNVSGPLVPGDGSRIYAFCGPSGVGKTTTMAKLASRMSLSEGLNVVMALTDTYCVGAVEQSRRYAELIGVPMVVADRPEKFLSMLKAYNSADVILVDTPGRVYESDEAFNSLADILAMSGEPVETLLHVPAAYSPAHIKAIAKRFAPLNASRVIITKIDESVQAGSILNILNATSLPAAYLTTGSRVPEDIEVAVSERIARYILGSDN